MQQLLPAFVGAPAINAIHNMDAMTLLKHMPSQSVNCIVTSPPYFGLRDYGMAGQIGLEETPQQFVAKLVELFREARRVLRDDGTFWLNLGDTYTGGGRGGNPPLSAYWKQGTNAGSVIENRTNVDGIPPKSLLGIPWRVAFALQDDGWILRSEIIWNKLACMPESVTDRPTKSHETVFLFAKSPRYYYDMDAIREPQQEESLERVTRGWNGNGDRDYPGGPQNHMKNYMGKSKEEADTLPGRNKRTVWSLTPEPFSGAHFATFPTKLIEPMILAGCPEKVCSKCGAPWIRIVEKPDMSERPVRANSSKMETDKVHISNNWQGVPKSAGAAYQKWRNENPNVTTGFKPTCECNAETRAGVVYDPFMGSGTTALVARKHGRSYIGSELNPEYAAIARERLRMPFDEREYTPPDKPLPKLVVQVGDIRLEQQVMFEDAQKPA